MKKFIMIAVLFAVTAVFGEVREYSEAEFTRAQLENKSVVIDVAAWWCPVCRVQQSRLKSLVTENADFKNIIILVVSNGDSEAKQKFTIASRGTLVAFKGKSEKGRLVLETDRDKIRTLLRSSL